jgi:pimeloyl-ACP methyl ester carboxylesterase
MAYNTYRMQVIVDSILTQYVRQGKGKTIVVLHGWADSSAGLHSLCTSLGRQYDVIAVDLPGFGGSAAPSTAWGLDEYATFVQSFLKKVGVKKVWAYIGHSNGGAMAVRGIANDTLDAERLVLLASAGVRNVYKGRNHALRILAKTGKLVTAPLPASVKKTLRRKVYKTIGSDMLVAEHMQETFKRVVTDDVREDAAKLTVPTLLVYGEDDEATPVWFGEQFHELIDGSTLEILPGAGHFVHLDRPKEVEKALEGFLR